jgi:transcriptional regulator with XRE-family HTH domain
MPDFNREWQTHENGPLTKALKARIHRVRSAKKLTLKDLGDRFGISGAFVSNLLKDKDANNVRSTHLPRIVAALEGLEHEVKVQSGEASSLPAAALPQQPDDQWLEQFVRIAHAKGFEVTVRPLRAQ